MAALRCETVQFAAGRATSLAARPSSGNRAVSQVFHRDTANGLRPAAGESLSIHCGPAASNLTPCSEYLSHFNAARARVLTRAAGERYEFQTDVNAEVKEKSIICSNCTGNGAVACSQCKGSGLNSVDHFDGRFKAGHTCWLCRGKKQMLCGECNGAGFVGGFLSTQDD